MDRLPEQLFHYVITTTAAILCLSHSALVNSEIRLRISSLSLSLPLLLTNPTAQLLRPQTDTHAVTRTYRHSGSNMHQELRDWNLQTTLLHWISLPHSVPLLLLLLCPSRIGCTCSPETLTTQYTLLSLLPSALFVWTLQQQQGSGPEAVRKMTGKENTVRGHRIKL